MKKNYKQEETKIKENGMNRNKRKKNMNIKGKEGSWNQGAYAKKKQ